MKKNKKLIFLAMILTIISTVMIILIADTPEKIYLNPIIGDIVVLIAGAFLLIDTLKYINYRRFYSTILRAMIGTSMVTTHIMQFILDFIKLN